MKPWLPVVLLNCKLHRLPPSMCLLRSRTHMHKIFLKRHRHTNHTCVHITPCTDRSANWKRRVLICEPGQVPGSNGKEQKTEKYMSRVNLQLTKTQRDKQGRDGRPVKQTVMSKWTRHERWKELFLEMLFQMLKMYEIRTLGLEHSYKCSCNSLQLYTAFLHCRSKTNLCWQWTVEQFVTVSYIKIGLNKTLRHLYVAELVVGRVCLSLFL